LSSFLEILLTNLQFKVEHSVSDIAQNPCKETKKEKCSSTKFEKKNRMKNNNNKKNFLFFFWKELIVIL